MTFHPTNLAVHVLASTNITYRNGRSISIQNWDGGWTHETSWVDYTANGTRCSFSITEASDSPSAVTNQISQSDFLGRTVETLTPGAAGGWLVTSNAYDGATSRLTCSETTGQPATTYLYDALGEMVATVQSGIATASETRYETIGGEVWQVVARSTSWEGVTNDVATTRQQMTGLSNSLRSRTVSIDPNGSTTMEESAFDPQTCELMTTRTTDSATPFITISKFGRTIRRESLRDAVDYYFDPLGRAEYSVAYHPVTDELLYDRWSAFDESDNETDYGIYYYGDDLHVSGSRTFDAFNREVTRTDALGNTVTTAYDALGRPVATSGATYPVLYGYDTMGRMKALGTTRDGSVFDETLWGYNHATGLVTNKLYADDSAVAYAYTSDGKPLRTTWARGSWKEQAYNADGLLTATTYSDATPAASLGYDAFQRLAFASNVVAAYTYKNSKLGTATNETVTLGGNVHVLARDLDALQRLQGLTLDGQPLATYAYDSENRLAIVSNASFVAEYAYTPDGWDADYTIALTNGITLSRELTRDPCRRNLITAITNGINGVALNSLAYDHDLLNRVVARNADTFGYNARSEVTSAAILSNAYAYAYDGIGNALWSTNNGVGTAFWTNPLNQYTNILCVSAPPRKPSYDSDGNLTTNGVWSYAWDAENRLVAAYSNNVCVISNAYDHMSRRVLKTSHGGAETRRYVYDGWLPILEIVASSSGVTTNAYVWGKDLSGTIQGAGGVGGMLAVSLNGAWYFPFYDANGYIVAYVDESGSVVAEYAYAPFGATIAKSGSMADAFAHRFSTKYFDAETRLYYYGYRFYDPVLRRWLNRDPIEEEGGLNLYGFCGNDGVNQWDFLGKNRMLTGSLMFVKGKSVRQEGFEKAREIIRLVDNLNQLRTKNGQRLYDAQIKDLVLTSLEIIKKEVESNADNIYIVAHGGLQVNGMKWGQYTYYWNKHDKVVEGIDIRHDGTLTPLSSFGPLKPSNIFGCYLSPRVRRVKRPFASTYSCKDTYNAMFGALYNKLLEYKTRTKNPRDCYPIQIRIYEGERADVYTSIGTEDALRRFPVKPEREYGIEEEEW